MPDKSILSLSDLVQKHKNDTHHIRVKIAPEMFHVYSRIMPAHQAQNLVCELLQISHAGFEYAMRADPLADLAVYKRDQTILDMRCDGFSFKAICQTVKLSRVQVWRIIRAFEEKIETVKFMECRHIKDTRLKYPELDKIKALRDRLKAMKPAESIVSVLENQNSRNCENNYHLKSISYNPSGSRSLVPRADNMAENCGYLN